MKTIKRILPVICITGLIIVISLSLYREMVKRETKKCWDELHDTAQYISEEIQAKFQDELVKLHLFEAIMVQDDVFTIDDIDVLHLDTVQPTTIFSRVDVLFPDKTFYSKGTSRVLTQELSFDEIANTGEYLTTRQTDYSTGEECVYYVLPVIKEQKLLAVLIGMIDANSLSNVFQPDIYNEQANICLIDSKDGSYIMDSWHPELGNVYNDEEREKLDQYKDVNLQESLMNLETGTVAFISRTTGKPLYMYYTPINMFDWQLAIFASEDALFENLYSLRHILFMVGLTEALLLIVYFLWNLRTVIQLEKSLSEIEKQKEQLTYISYRDSVTALYNRTRYTEVLTSLENTTAKDIGVAYIDLNGLKQVNDTQGHTAGDTFIRNAARLLSDLFGENCYRIGGDEFVILEFETTYDDFMARIRQLQQTADCENVSLSIGSYWEEKCDDLEDLLKKAESQMYAEKETYYLSHDRIR